MSSQRISRRQQGLFPIENYEVEQELDSLKTRATYHTNTKDNKCIIYNATGEIYRGQMCNNMRHGKGQMIYENGVIYEGLWENDKPKHVQIYVEDESVLNMVQGWLNYLQNKKI